MSLTSAGLLAEFSTFHPREIDLGLDRFGRLLGHLDNPHLRLPPVIHIAGTNGKGSTLAYLKALLAAAGQRVHRYTSPHLETFHERIEIDGHPISEDGLVSVLQRIRESILHTGLPITYFEATTAAAFMAFSENPADVLLLETGLGGRLDATNIVPPPRLTVISRIHFDHEKFLGTTLPAIAGEKLGIAKPDVPLIVGPQEAELYPLFIETAARLQAPLHLFGRDWAYEETGNGFIYQDQNQKIECPTPALLGPHQVENAALAMAAYTQLGLPAHPEALTQARWPARFEPCRKAGNLLQSVYLDGGHNPSGLESWVKTLNFLENRDGPADTAFILAFIDSKDVRRCLEILKPLNALVYFPASPDFDHRVPAEQLARTAESLDMTAYVVSDVAAALQDLASKNRRQRVLIGGSLYFAGKVRSQLV